MRAPGIAGAIALLLMGTGLLANREPTPLPLPHAKPLPTSSAAPGSTVAEGPLPAIEPSGPDEAGIREIPLDTLSDVAVATYSDDEGSAIYYNPGALAAGWTLGAR